MSSNRKYKQGDLVATKSQGAVGIILEQNISYFDKFGDMVWSVYWFDIKQKCNIDELDMKPLRKTRKKNV